MFRNERLEMKVGLFMGLGIFLMFFIVFSISDLQFFKKDYSFSVVFDFVNGITDDAPVRLAGVHVGDVKDLLIYYDKKAGRTRVKLDVAVREDIRIETDAVARINTLGLLGEQYLEITPGVSGKFLSDGDVMTGRNPVNMGEQMERMGAFVDKIEETLSGVGESGTFGKLLSDETLYVEMTGFFSKLNSGEGTLGKLVSDETLYNDLEGIFGRLNRGEGTLGKLLVDDKVYNDLETFTSDIKAHPWKLLHKTSDRKKRKDKEVHEEGTRSNFGPAR